MSVLASQGLGYRKECGYQQILYPTDRDVEDLLHWAVKTLPQPEDEVEEDVRPSALLRRGIRHAMQQWVARPFLGSVGRTSALPPPLQTAPLALPSAPTPPTGTPGASAAYLEQHSPSLPSRASACGPRALLSSALERAAERRGRDRDRAALRAETGARSQAELRRAV